MDNDLISRAAIKKEIDKLEKEEHSISPSWFLGLDDCRDIVDCIPAVDAVPVIRCKDCKNFDSSTEGRYVGGWCFCEKLQFSTSPDWFCADVERVDAPTCGPDYCEIGGEDDADG